ncbi:COMM domain-containing protein 3 [Engraulis encrasicolus]|uniref:COMM domain-containing protein 3 n=1 Tax=Engraulis encrasicolus TaxID=184585 RepID=UPI002FCFB5F7
MELSDSVQKGLQYLADPVHFDLKTFTTFTDAAFQSLLSSQSECGLDNPQLKNIDQTILKHCHLACTTFILESVKQSADKSTISSCLEDASFDTERIDVFYSSYQNHKRILESLLESIGRSPPHITDVLWRLDYCIKNSHVHKVNQPSYLISLHVENDDSAGPSKDVNFNCTMEQLQDLVGKMKDAAKSLEKATQS